MHLCAVIEKTFVRITMTITLNNILFINLKNTFYENFKKLCAFIKPIHFYE